MRCSLDFEIVRDGPARLAGGDVAGYHFYPGRQRVLDWFVAEGLEVLQETFKQEHGWGYRHFLLCDRFVQPGT